MEGNREQFQRLRKYLAQTQGQRYPFRGHCLEKEDHYIKNLYLKHLCLVAQSGTSIDEMQTLFLQRLVAGCGAEYDRGTYMRQGGEADENSLEELFEQLLKHDLREAFLLDAMLVIHLGEEDREQDEFVAQLCEAMRIGPDELERLARLCAGVLRVDLRACLEWAVNGCAQRLGHLWAPYLPEGLPPAWAAGEGGVIAMAGSPTRFDCGQMDGVSERKTVNPFNLPEYTLYEDREFMELKQYPYVLFQNLIIPVDTHMSFSDIDCVKFEGCTFLGSGDNLKNAASLWFERCPLVVFQNCEFRDFSGRVMYITGGNEVRVEGCAFTNCMVKYRYNNSDWREFGAIVHNRSYHALKLLLRKSTFTNCGGRNSNSYYVTSVISNCAVSIYDCEFEDCWHFHTGGVRDDTSNGRLFEHIVEESGNKVTDSANLGPS